MLDVTIQTFKMFLNLRYLIFLSKNLKYHILKIFLSFYMFWIFFLVKYQKFKPFRT